MAPPVEALRYCNHLHETVASDTFLRDFDILLGEAPLLEHLVLGGDTPVPDQDFVGRITARNLLKLDVSSLSSLLMYYMDTPCVTTLSLNDFDLPEFLRCLNQTPDLSFPAVTSLKLAPRR